MPNINDWLTYNGSEYEINGTTYRNLEAQVKRNQQVSIYAQQLSDNNNTQIEAFREELADYDLLDGYVTPQVYGAIADGTTDCTDAIQQAVDSGKHVLFPAGEYAMAGTVTLFEKNKLVFDAIAATIKYTGSSYAFEIIHCENCLLRFGSIATTTGGCIHFSADGNTINPNFTETIGAAWSQYINIDFLVMACNDSDIVYDTTDPDNPVYLYNLYDCIHGVQANNGTSNYVNEIRINNGRFMRGQAVRLVQKENIANGRFTTWRFTNVAFEGYSGHTVKGFRLDAPSATTKKSSYCFINCRCNENVDYAMDFSSDGYDCEVSKVYWFGPINMYDNYFKFTTKTRGYMVGDLAYGTQVYDSCGCRVYNGYLIPESYSARCPTSSSSDLSGKVPMQCNKYIFVNNAAVTELILPDYYFGRRGAINDFYIKFQHNKTSFNISVMRGGTATLMGTIPSVSANDVVHVVWFSSGMFDDNTGLLQFVKETSL